MLTLELYSGNDFFTYSIKKKVTFKKDLLPEGNFYNSRVRTGASGRAIWNKKSVAEMIDTFVKETSLTVCLKDKKYNYN